MLNLSVLVACLRALFVYLDYLLSKKEVLRPPSTIRLTFVLAALIVGNLWSLFVLVLVWYSDNYSSYFTLFFTSSGLCLQF